MHIQRLVSFVLLGTAAPANGSNAALLSEGSMACGSVVAELRKHFSVCVCVFEWVAANVVAKYSIGNSFEGEQVIKLFVLFDEVPLLCKVAKEFVSNI